MKRRGQGRSEKVKWNIRERKNQSAKVWISGRNAVVPFGSPLTPCLIHEILFQPGHPGSVHMKNDLDGLFDRISSEGRPKLRSIKALYVGIFQNWIIERRGLEHHSESL
jgi:hypothetical protein